MVNLFDIMQHAQNGTATASLARQFGLSMEQTQRALEAVLPAFSIGFQRSSRTPDAFAGVLEMMTSNRFAPFYEGAGGLAQAGASGQQVVDRLFGSSEISRQIASQASAMTGIGTQVLQQMLPVIGATLMGGMVRAASVDGMADFLRGWSDWLRNAGSAARRQSTAGTASSPYAAWSEMMGTMLGGGSPPPPPPVPAPDPWSAMMGAMLGLPPAKRPPAPPPAVPNPFETLARMFDTGREAQAQHLTQLQKIMGDMLAPKRAG